MIRTEEEYQAAIDRVEDEKQAIHRERQSLIEKGFSPEEAEVALEPYIAFRLQFVDEIEEYERLRRGLGAFLAVACSRSSAALPSGRSLPSGLRWR